MAVPLLGLTIDQSWDAQHSEWSGGDENVKSRPFRDVGDFKLFYSCGIDFDGPPVDPVQICKLPKTLSEAFVLVNDSGVSVDPSIIQALNESTVDLAMTLRIVKAFKRLIIHYRLTNGANFDVFGREPIRCTVTGDAEPELDTGDENSQRWSSVWSHFVGSVDPPFASPKHQRRRVAGVETMPIVIKATFKFRRFCFPKLFSILAGFAFLLSVAHLLVVKIAQNVLAEKDQYTDLMVEKSKDFFEEAPAKDTREPLTTADGP
eukprot:CAMPEP_0179162452 /NCGR_PEP_ID=MMETSP0796-20121207/79585_1 /TAXON_ID=73915 /ORGANISM="Pyrodinium bahamense, Strain pbaha01" /LENGTH=261 /DNA_ID=CAMNT_0020864659 /DNA_START=347 /DNA_END=1132 /DNA_ORIENTATION=+